MCLPHLLNSTCILTIFPQCVVKELHNTSPDSTRMLQEEVFSQVLLVWYASCRYFQICFASWQAKRLYELDHPCIPKLKAFFDMPGERKFYVVMDLIDGEVCHAHYRLRGVSHLA